MLVDENGAPRVLHPAVAWVVVLYNPSCMMSRAVAPLIELAAAQSVETRFAAFACGGHGAEKVEFERKGFAAVFEDPICQALEPGFSESPRIAAAAGAGEGPAPRLFSGAWRRRACPIVSNDEGRVSVKVAARSTARTTSTRRGGLRVALYLDASPEGNVRGRRRPRRPLSARARGCAQRVLGSSWKPALGPRAAASKMSGLRRCSAFDDAWATPYWTSR